MNIIDVKDKFLKRITTRNLFLRLTFFLNITRNQKNIFSYVTQMYLKSTVDFYEISNIGGQPKNKYARKSNRNV